MRNTTPIEAASSTAAPKDVLGRFRPRISLRTLGRGDGLLGLRPAGLFGPRGNSVTVAQIDWTYTTPDGVYWETTAPTSLLETTPDATQELFDAQGKRLVMRRNAHAETDALEQIRDLGLLPLPEDALQWRADDMAPGTQWWSLLLESAFGDFWADNLPQLQADGWRIVVHPGFAHESVPVEAWRIIVNPDTGDVLGKEVATRMHGRTASFAIGDGPGKSEWWLLTLGVEIDGVSFDLAPMLADLLRRDLRWVDRKQIAAIDPHSRISLRAPGGKRIDALAAPLIAIVTAMLDLLTDQKRKPGPLRLSPWDAQRLDALGIDLLQADMAFGGMQGPLQLQGGEDLRALAQRLRGSGEPQAVPPPTGLGITLRPYQLHGLAWLQYLREHKLAGILADDMGLGKTAQIVAHLLVEQQAGRLDLPALVVLPTSLVFNWQAEIQRMAPDLRVLALQGPKRAEDYARITHHDVILTTYPLLWRDLDQLMQVSFHMLVLDEAQTVKNAAGRSASAVRRIRARHRLCMTGTPMENHLGELWTQFNFLMPGFLGDATTFARQWRKPIEENGETLRATLLAQRIRPFILRRRKENVATELPPKTEVVKLLRLQGSQRDLYESIRVAADRQVRRVLQNRGFTGSQVSIMDALLKLRQVCCDPLLLKGEKVPKSTERAKIDMLRDMLPSLVAEGRRILVFSQFTEMLALVEKELDAINLDWLSLTGKTPPPQRSALVARFQSKTVPILLISLKAGGVGLNLTSADTVIMLDPWWNPAVEDQAIARAHRIGQDQPVFVYKLVIEGSIEERILELQARKSALTEDILGSDAAFAPKFNAADLDALLAPLGTSIAPPITR